MQKNTIVIGAGFGGLSIAALLARDGHTVTILEKNDRPGGRARVWQDKGFTFDMGPSWYMNPDIFEHFFARFGKQPSDYYKLNRLDPSYRLYFGTNDVVDVPADFEKTKTIFESIEPGAGEALQRYSDAAAYQYKISVEEFLYKDYRSIFDFVNKRILREGRRLHLLENLHTYTGRFFKSERLRKMLEYTMVFLGGAPSNTPALYSLISYVDMQLGIWYPDGGIGSVVSGIERLAREQGVQIRYGADVTHIEVRDGVATGVYVGETYYPADCVVVNGDYHYAETQLLEPRHQTYPERYWQKRTMAPSAFIMYLGINKRLPQLAHHTLFLQNDWTKHFDQIFSKHPTWPDQPSYYVCAPSRTDPTVAPADHENIFVLVPVASGLEDTEEVRTAYTERILTHLEQLIGEPLRDHIVTQRIFAHNDFTADYHAYKGTGLGMAHTLTQTAVFRPAHRSKKVRGLYYTGQYTHPGIGMPMTLISSEVVRGIIANEVQ